MFNSAASWWSSSVSFGSVREKRGAHPGRRPLRLERLEDRRLLSLSITEIMYNPYPAMNSAEEAFESKEDFEFIEVTNTGTTSIWLAGYEFTKGITFRFEDGRIPILSAGESAVVVQNEDAFRTRYGTGLPVTGVYGGRLSNSGEQLILIDGLGNTVHDFEFQDGGSWPGRADGNGSSLVVRDTQGDYRKGDNWASSRYFGGTPGTHGPLPPDDVVVNEVLTHSDLPASDTIELFNTADTEIDISGWYLSDSSDDYLKFCIPAGTVIPAGGYVLFNEADFNVSGGVNPKDFALSSSRGDHVWLMEADSAGKLIRFADHVDFPAAYNGETFGRWPNGSGRLYPMASATLGGENSGPRVGPVVITEIQYNPGSMANNADLEFIEIHNPTNHSVNLSGWRLGSEVDFTFSPGSVLGSGQTVVVVGFDPNNSSQLAAFRDHYNSPTVSPVGPWGRDGSPQKLDNAGATVTLYSTDDPPTSDPTLIPYCIEDQVRYDDKAPWPESADGSGDSLHRISADVWGNDAASWLAATPSPGVVEFGTSLLPGDLNGDNFVGGADLDIIRSNWGNSVPPGSLAHGDPSGDGKVDSTDLDIVRANWGQGVAPSAAAKSAFKAESSATRMESAIGKNVERGKATALTKMAWLEQQTDSYRDGRLGPRKNQHETLSDLVFALFAR